MFFARISVQYRWKYPDSCRMSLTNHTKTYITPLVINALRSGQTDTQAHILMREKSDFKKPGTWLAVTRTWFNNGIKTIYSDGI